MNPQDIPTSPTTQQQQQQTFYTDPLRSGSSTTSSPNLYSSNSSNNLLSFNSPNTNNSSSITTISKDPIQQFLKDKEFPPIKKKKVNEVKDSLDGCAELAKSESWKELLKLCEKQLQLPGKPNELLQFRLCQLITLLRLNLYDYASQCVEMMGDLENNSSYFYEKYPNIYRNQKNGNMMPFSILLIKAIVPLMQYLNAPVTANATSTTQSGTNAVGVGSTGSSNNANTNNAGNVGSQQQQMMMMGGGVGTTDQSFISIERLYALLKMCSDQIKDEKTGQRIGGLLSIKKRRMNHNRIYFNNNIQSLSLSSASCPFEGTQEEWRIREQRIVFLIITCHIARKEYSLAITLLEKALKYFKGDVSGSTTSLLETDFQTYQRLESLLGCLYLQQGMTKPAKDHFQNVEKREKNSDRSVLVKTNSGILKFAYGHYSEANKDFTFILRELDPYNLQVANNKAICLLYMGELTKAIEFVEEFIRQDPYRCMDENLVYNLSTLYDLESSESNEKKMMISSIAHRFKGDDFVNWIVQ